MLADCLNDHETWRNHGNGYTGRRFRSLAGPATTCGLVGLLFASVGSIIGSGWLFGALNAVQAGRPRRRHLVGARRRHDPADRPRLRRARHDVPAVRRRGALPAPGLRPPSRASPPAGSPGSRWPRPRRSRSRRRCSTPPSTPPSPSAHTVDGETVHTLTGARLRRRGRADGAVRGRQLLRRPLVRPDQQRAGVVEARIILLVIVAFLLTAFHGENFTSHGFAPTGWHGVFTAIATSRHRVLLPRLPAGHRAGRRDRQPEAQRADRGRSARCC